MYAHLHDNRSYVQEYVAKHGYRRVEQPCADTPLQDDPEVAGHRFLTAPCDASTPPVVLYELPGARLPALRADQREAPHEPT
jgi:hypothetical protein